MKREGALATFEPGDVMVHVCDEDHGPDEDGNQTCIASGDTWECGADGQWRPRGKADAAAECDGPATS